MVKKLLIFAVIVASALFAQSQVFSQDEAAKPSYKNGETWLFTVKEGGSIGSTSNPINGTYELSTVDGKLKIARRQWVAERGTRSETRILGRLASLRSKPGFPADCGQTVGPSLQDPILWK